MARLEEALLNGTVNLSNPSAIFGGSPPRFTRSRVTYEANVVSRTSTRPQVDSALRILSGSPDGTVRFWDADTGQAIGTSLQGHTSWVRSVAFSPDGHRIVSASKDHTVRLWDANTGHPIVVRSPATSSR